MGKEKIYNQAVDGDEGFIPGEGYPSCDGEPCVNLSDEKDPLTDTMAREQPTGAPEGSPGADSQYREGDPQPRTEAEQEQSEREQPDRQEQAAPQPEDEVAQWKDRCLRLQAEFDNYRKRTLREKMEWTRQGSADVLKAILPVVDDIHRAVEAMDKSDDIEALRKGVRLIAQKCGDTLRQCGVVEIESIGQELDTDRHEAVARFAAGKEKRGRIIDVVQSGYMLADKVLRYAKVVVGE